MCYLRIGEIGYVLEPEAKLKKNKDTLFSLTVKVLEIKALLVVSIQFRGWDIAIFWIQQFLHLFDVVERLKNRLYLSPWGKIEKRHFICTSRKAWYSKMLLVLSILAQGLKNSHFLKLTVVSIWCGPQNMKKMALSQPLRQKKKRIKTLYFLQL